MSARRATSRRIGSNDATVMASGVSSTTTSTPAACSNARILRPARPMMRPFISSDGMGTMDTACVDTWSPATRCMATTSSLRARASPSSRASSSIWRMVRAMSARALVSTAAINCATASSRVKPETRSSSAIWSSLRFSRSLACLSKVLWRLPSSRSRPSSFSARCSSAVRRCSTRVSSCCSSLRRSCCSFSSSSRRFSKSLLALASSLLSCSRAWAARRSRVRFRSFKSSSMLRCRHQ